MGRLVLVLCLLAAVWGLPLHAQSKDLTANIPFAFEMSKTRMPAGVYLIQQQPGYVVFKEAHGAKSAIALVLRSERKTAPPRAELQFHRYGNTYFLSSVWSPYSAAGLILLKSAPEKELARNGGIVERAGVALQHK